MSHIRTKMHMLMSSPHTRAEKIRKEIDMSSFGKQKQYDQTEMSTNAMYSQGKSTICYLYIHLMLDYLLYSVPYFDLFSSNLFWFAKEPEKRDNIKIITCFNACTFMLDSRIILFNTSTVTP